MKRLAAAILAAVVLAGLSACEENPGPCNATVSSAGAVQGAVNAAANGGHVCLADGTYPKLTINTPSGRQVWVEAEHPGQATVAGVKVTGRGQLIVARFRFTGTFEAGVGSQGATAFQDFFDLSAFSGFGVMACASTMTTCDDVSIIGNRFVGRSEEDAIRANRYHDADGNGFGLAVMYNEFSGNQETGDHNDVFQSVWVGDHLNFSYNWVHDFGGQGFFVKDQASAINGLVAEQNIIESQNLPCDPTSLCPTWQLSPFQIFGPATNVKIDHNTVGFGKPGSGFGVLTGSLQGTFTNNAFQSLGVTNSGGSGVVLTGSNNSRCSGNGWPAPAGTLDGVCSVPDSAVRGATWDPADEHFGP